MKSSGLRGGGAECNIRTYGENRLKKGGTKYDTHGRPFLFIFALNPAALYTR